MSRVRSAVPRSGYDALWEWFGLSRASFLTLPRALMHEMPHAWQARMATLLAEWNAAYPFLENKGHQTHVSLRRDRRFVKAPDWMVNYRHPDRVEIERHTR